MGKNMKASKNILPASRQKYKRIKKNMWLEEDERSQGEVEEEEESYGMLTSVGGGVDLGMVSRFFGLFRVGLGLA